MISKIIVFHFFLTFIPLLSINETHGKAITKTKKNPFDLPKTYFSIAIDNIKCSSNPHYAYPAKCSVDKNYEPEHGYFELQMRREIKSQKYTFSLSFGLKANKKRTILSLKNNDACAFFEGRTNSFLKVIKQQLEGYGELPKKCPYKNFHYLFKDVFWDIRKFPPYMLETDFYLITNNSVGNDFLFSIQVWGRIRRNYVNDTTTNKNDITT